LASGVLVICVGHATRLIDYVQRLPKGYAAVFQLGRRSPSDDLETEVELLNDVPTPPLAEIQAALPDFTGEIQQRPPAYSAVKLEGRRAYRLARRGEAIELAPRPVHVYELEIEHYEYPELRLRIRCGRGTYVRSLGRDLAGQLGTAAVMADLVRTAVGPFRNDQGLQADLLSEVTINDHLLPATAAVSELPRAILTSEQVAHLSRGGLISLEELNAQRAHPAAEFAAIDHQGKLVAILKPARQGLLKPSPNFSQAE
jgi:tRNA pseudouridine55 synthase